MVKGMTRLLFIFACQLLLSDISDKFLKEVPKPEQSIDTENENTSEPAVFAPPVSDDRVFVDDSNEKTHHRTSNDTLGFCSENERCGRDGEDVSARRYNNTVDVDVSGSVNDDTEQEKVLVESVEDKSDTTAAVKDNVHLKSADTTSEECLPYAGDTSVTGDVGSSQLNQRVANVPISDLRARVYQKLGDVLENPNTHDEKDPWWNYLILNDDDLDINRRQQRNMENRPEPGREFLDILDESGYTLQDLENLFMRHQMHVALDVLRSNQFEVVGQRSNNNAYTEREAGDSRKPEDDLSNSSSGESEIDNEKEDGNQYDEKEMGALNKDETSIDSTDNDMHTSAQEKTQTSNFDHCKPNPCKNEGKCIGDEDGYKCECSYKWYSGKNCEKDNGPCRNACFKPGTGSCYYSPPDGQNTVCNCKVGYDGDQCETKHDYYAKYPIVRPVIDSCNERGLSKDECIADTLGVDTEVNTLEGLLQNILKDMFLNVADKLLSQGGNQKVFGDGDVGKVVDKWKNVFH